MASPVDVIVFSMIKCSLDYKTVSNIKTCIDRNNKCGTNTAVYYEDKLIKLSLRYRIDSVDNVKRGVVWFN